MTNSPPRLPLATRRFEQRPPSDAAAPGQQFMTQLRDDHAEHSRILSLLSSELERLASQPGRVLSLLAEAFAFITMHMDATHHPREDVLFARLARRSRRDARRLAELRESHESGTATNRELSDRIAEARRNPDLERLAALRRELAAYVEEAREHIGSEERVFYSRAMQTLDAADWAAIERNAPRLELRTPPRSGARRASSPVRRQARLSGPRYIRGDRDGVLGQMGIDRAGLVYGEVFGHAMGTLMLAGTQGREAASLAGRILRACLTPRSPAAYPGAVLDTFGVGLRTATRWAETWRDHLRTTRSLWTEAFTTRQATGSDRRSRRGRGGRAGCKRR